MCLDQRISQLTILYLYPSIIYYISNDRYVLTTIHAFVPGAPFFWAVYGYHPHVVSRIYVTPQVLFHICTFRRDFLRISIFRATEKWIEFKALPMGAYFANDRRQGGIIVILESMEGHLSSGDSPSVSPLVLLSKMGFS